MAAAAVSFAARLSALEAKLGFSSEQRIGNDYDNNNQNDITVTTNDLNHRVAVAEATYQQTILSSLQRSGWDTVWKESEALLRDLDPGSALTYQLSAWTTTGPSSSSSSTLTSTSFQQPILYRRQEILGAAESLQHDMELLKQALQLLQIASTTTSSSSSSSHTAATTTTSASSTPPLLREEQVTQAPILVNIPSMSQDDWQRLERMQAQLMELQQRCVQAQRRIQRLVEQYHTIILAVSEKLVLADEQLKEKEM